MLRLYWVMNRSKQPDDFQHSKTGLECGTFSTNFLIIINLQLFSGFCLRAFGQCLQNLV